MRLATTGCSVDRVEISIPVNVPAVVPEGPAVVADLGDLVPEAALVVPADGDRDRVVERRRGHIDPPPPARVVAGSARHQHQVVERGVRAALLRRVDVAVSPTQLEAELPQHQLERAVLVEAVARAARRADPLEARGRFHRW